MSAVSSTFARGDGVFGALPAPVRTAIRSRRARRSDVTLATRKDQALLYRLNGDRNPLHADPELAKRVGFPAPILHGLCTYGIACRAILQTVAAYDHTRITGFDVRFSAPVYPGESIATDIWVDGRTVSFRCRIPERNDTVVINNALRWLRIPLRGTPTATAGCEPALPFSRAAGPWGRSPDLVASELLHLAFSMWWMTIW